MTIIENPRQQLRVLLYAALSTVVIALFAIALTMQNLRSDADDEARRAMTGLVMALASQTRYFMDSVDISLLAVRDEVETMGVHDANGVGSKVESFGFHRFLADKLRYMPNIASLAVFNSDGDMVSHSRYFPNPPISAKNRSIPRSFLANDSDVLYVTEPFVKVLDRQSAQFLIRKIRNSEGKAVGFAVAEVRDDFASVLFDPLLRSKGLSFHIYREDGVLLVTSKGGDPVFGIRAAGSSEWNNAVRAGHGYFTVPLSSTAPATLVALQKLPNHPLVVQIEMNEDIIRAPWRARSAWIFIGTLLIIACVLFLMKRLADQVRNLMESEESLRQREASLANKSMELEMAKLHRDTALGNMTQGLALFGSDHRLIICNERYYAMYNLTAEQVYPGMLLEEIIRIRVENGYYAGPNPEQFLATLMQAAGTRQQKIDQLADGRTISLRVEPLATGGYISTHEDITVRTRAVKQIAYLAQHDSLTGLANRDWFMRQMETAMAAHSDEATGPASGMNVILIDLDHFKAVNDTRGHGCGDALLVAVASRLCEVIGPSGTVGRLGGDEFAAFLPVGSQNQRPVQDIAASIVQQMSEPFMLGGITVNVGASVGIACTPEDARTPDEILLCADLALYRAKKAGRSCYIRYEPGMDQEMRLRREMESDLRHALELDQIILNYQPIIGRQDGRIGVMEALARWHHPRLGVVSPLTFITIAEETGFIGELGRWILRRACFDAVSWPGNVRLAVNISVAQLADENLIATVRDALADSGLAASRLELEITESVFLRNDDANMNTLHELRDLGIQIVLDDFGTGYSSLSYLNRFPFSKLKIDKSFIDDLPTRSDSAAIIAAITGLSRTLGIVTVAEGVETAAQYELLRLAGCDEFQGYYFGRPALLADLCFDRTFNARTEAA